MPSPSPPVQPGNDTIPPTLLVAQRQSESLFMAARAQERRLIALRGAPPEPFHRPAPLPRPLRALLRLLPPLERAWQVRVIRSSGMFDPAWYLAQNPDVAATGADPARHFLRHGAAEGRDPGPRFAVAHYLRLYPDVAKAGVNPLIHYLIAGRDELRSIRPEMPERQA